MFHIDVHKVTPIREYLTTAVAKGGSGPKGIIVDDKKAQNPKIKNSIINLTAYLLN